MENTKICTIPAEVLDKFDSLEWEDSSPAFNFGFHQEGYELSEGDGGLLLYGTYPAISDKHYLIFIYQDDTSTILCFKRAEV